MKYLKLLLYILIFSTIVSCEDYYRDGGKTSIAPLNMSSIEFIESRPDIFDTTLLILRKSGLDKVLEEGKYTFFIPQKESIIRLLKNVHSYVKENKDSLGYEKDTVLIDDIKADIWKKYMSRYIFEGEILRDDIAKGAIVKISPKESDIEGGKYYESYMGYNMLLYLDYTSWKGVEEAGPRLIGIIDMKEEYPDDDFVDESIITSNLRTKNGVIHVLSKGHTFGFDNHKFFIEAKNQ